MSKAQSSLNDLMAVIDKAQDPAAVEVLIKFMGALQKYLEVTHGIRR